MKKLCFILSLALTGCFDKTDSHNDGASSDEYNPRQNSNGGSGYVGSSTNQDSNYVPDSTPIHIDGSSYDPPPRENRDVFNRNVIARRKKYVGIILQASHRHGVEPEFIHAIITKETNYQHQISSGADAHGLMQLLPGTGRRFGCTDLLNAQCNVNAGTGYLKYLLKRFGGNIQSAAAGYNAGEAVVDSYLHGTRLHKKNGGIKTPNGVPLASFAYSASQSKRCPENNYHPTPDCEGQTYEYVRKVTWSYIYYKKHPELIGKTSGRSSSQMAHRRGEV